MQKAFTLVEILVGMSIFVFVLFSLQAFSSSVFSTGFRGIAMQKLADSTRASLEIMGREMRLAKKAEDASCIPIGQSFLVTSPGPSEGNAITFIDFDGRCIAYTFDSAANVVSKKIGTSAAQTFLGGLSKVSDARFFLITGASQQPRVVMRVKAETNDPTAPNQILEIAVQTTVSQRELKID
ncbi:MAG: hypothetical protein HY001_02690 [Candidatus Portnoybacteria bacterium]|nr:hypothetical protein [Candidatus Portnoybacteria bacterium]